MGFVRGTCAACGKIIYRDSRFPVVVTCDCYRYCPLCNAEMTPYMPDLNPMTYRNEDCPEWDSSGSTGKSESSALTIYICKHHDPPYYSNRLPEEVKLE